MIHVRKTYTSMTSEQFNAYWAGRWAAAREHWMELAREEDLALRPLRVNLARNAHRESLRYLKLGRAS